MQFHSEGREWGLAAALVLGTWVVCVAGLRWATTGWEGTLSDVMVVIWTVFAILGGAGGFLAVQALRFRHGRAVLVRQRGEVLLRALGAEFQGRGAEFRMADCRFAPSFGYWKSMGRLRFPDGEIEVKEVWFSTLFYGTQVALRGEVDQEAVRLALARARSGDGGGAAALGEAGGAVGGTEGAIAASGADETVALEGAGMQESADAGGAAERAGGEE